MDVDRFNSAQAYKKKVVVFPTCSVLPDSGKPGIVISKSRSKSLNKLSRDTCMFARFSTRVANVYRWTVKRGPSRYLFHITSRGNEGIKSHVPRLSRVVR